MPHELFLAVTRPFSVPSFELSAFLCCEDLGVWTGRSLLFCDTKKHRLRRFAFQAYHEPFKAVWHGSFWEEEWGLYVSLCYFFRCFFYAWNCRRQDISVNKLRISMTMNDVELPKHHPSLRRVALPWSTSPAIYQKVFPGLYLFLVVLLACFLPWCRCLFLLLLVLLFARLHWFSRLGCLLEGWYRQSWKRRFFKLQDLALIYYTDAKVL